MIIFLLFTVIHIAGLVFSEHTADRFHNMKTEVGQLVLEVEQIHQGKCYIYILLF